MSTPDELEEFFDLSIDLLCIVGSDGYIKRASASLVRTLGYPEDELVSLSVLDITHADDVQRAGEALGRLGDGHDLLGFESRVVCADGSVRWLEWNTRALPERGVVYAVGRDTTERRRADAELREAQHALEASRDELRLLADEQAALRRVATMVAQDAPADALFRHIVEEVGTLLGVDAVSLGGNHDGKAMSPLAMWSAHGDHPPAPDPMPIEPGSLAWEIVRTGKPARKDDWSGVESVTATLVRDQLGARSSVGAPIDVGGKLWGAIAVHSTTHPLPPSTEARLERFAALVVTALTNAHARGEVRRLADEQTALRRVATLVARQTPQADVFRAIAHEIGGLLSVDSVAMVRYEEEPIGVVVATAGPIADALKIGTRAPLGGHNLASLVFGTGRAARIDDYAREASGPFGEHMRAAGARSIVATPITVEGRLWGAMLAITHDAPLPPDTETRIGQFTALMATAIANAEARAEVTRLADEQAALRRVATLVAEGASPSAVFDAVTGEVAELLDVSAVSLARYGDDRLTVVAQRGAAYVTVGQDFPLGGANVTSQVMRTGRTARMDDIEQATGRIGDVARGAGVRAAVAVPVVVDGRTWGVLAALWAHRRPAPDETEERMERFAELLDTAIANADSRDQLTASRVRLLAAGDDARRRVVRDLHDGAQQQLVNTVLTLKLAQRALGAAPGPAAGHVADAIESAERGIEEIRELARGLHPRILSLRGLAPALQTLADRSPVPVTLAVRTGRLPDHLEATAYFVVSEALANAAKHAQASAVDVTVEATERELRLAIADDGAGGADPARGSGLLGLRDRVEALGGTLTVESAAGQGTRLSVAVPV